MCLNTVDKETKKGSGYGYKLFEDWNGELHPWFIGRGSVLAEEEWIAARGGTLPVGKKKYRLGFHIFTTKAGAKALQETNPFEYPEVIRRVKFKEVVASGKQGMGDLSFQQVIVARKMYICKGKV